MNDSHKIRMIIKKRKTEPDLKYTVIQNTLVLTVTSKLIIVRTIRSFITAFIMQADPITTGQSKAKICLYFALYINSKKKKINNGKKNVIKVQKRGNTVPHVLSFIDGVFAEAIKRYCFITVIVIVKQMVVAYSIISVKIRWNYQS